MHKEEVLRGVKNFSAVYRRGRSVGDKYVVVFYRKNDLSYNRMGFLASKKVGNAVERNRARRLMKESYRLMEPLQKKGYDIVVIARKTIKDRKCADVKKSLEAALKRTDLKRG